MPQDVQTHPGYHLLSEWVKVASRCTPNDLLSYQQLRQLQRDPSGQPYLPYQAPKGEIRNYLADLPSTPFSTTSASYYASVNKASRSAMPAQEDQTFNFPLNMVSGVGVGDYSSRLRHLASQNRIFANASETAVPLLSAVLPNCSNETATAVSLSSRRTSDNALPFPLQKSIEKNGSEAVVPTYVSLTKPLANENVEMVPKELSESANFASDTEPSALDDNERQDNIHVGAKSCKFCGKIFKFSSHLREHRCRQNTEQSFNCHICQYNCSSASKLKQHIKLYHRKMNSLATCDHQQIDSHQSANDRKGELCPQMIWLRILKYAV